MYDIVRQQQPALQEYADQLVAHQTPRGGQNPRLLDQVLQPQVTFVGEGVVPPCDDDVPLIGEGPRPNENCRKSELATRRHVCVELAAGTGRQCGGFREG